MQQILFGEGADGTKASLMQPRVLLVFANKAATV